MAEMNNYAGTMNRVEFVERLKSTKAVIIPVGSCEQHGYHLPLDTDNLIGSALAEMAAKETDCIVMPPVNYGQVWSARKIVGSISLSNETVKAILRDIILSLESFGARNILILTGHNGNAPAVKELARELLVEKGIHNVWYWAPYADKSLMNILESPVPCGCVHAGEWETSLLLAICPELVHLENAEADFPVMPERAKYQPVSWDEYIKVGSFGDPTFATAEKGQRFIDACMKDLVHLIRDIME